MNRRHFRRSAPSETLAQARWLGWVMLMMFVLVQTAGGIGGRSLGTVPAHGALVNAQTHQMMVKPAG